MHKIILVLPFIFLFFIAESQVLSGKIIDKDSLEIPFAKVRIQNQSYGTVANAVGNYQLELKIGTYVIVYLADGFEIRIDTVSIIDLKTTHSVMLQEKTTQLEEVIVVAQSKKDKGKEVMKQAIEKRPYFQDLLAEYSCETYCFSTLEKDVLDSLIKDSVIGKDKLNLIEWRAKTYYKKLTKFKDEFYAYNDFADNHTSYDGSTTTVGMSIDLGQETPIATEGGQPSNPYLFVNGIKEAHFSIFDNSIDAPKLTQNPIVSPLAYNAFLYYNFYLQSAFVDSNNQLINEIIVKPKFDYEALFEGTIYIREGSWEVVSYDFKINPGVLLFFKDIHIICDYKKIDDRLVPVRREFVYNIKEDKTLINGLIRVSHSNYQSKIDDSKSGFWLETAVYNEDAFDKDSVYWNTVRPFTLKEFEKQFIEDQDSMIAYHESEEYLRQNDSIRNAFSIKAIFLSGYGHVNSFKKYEFTVAPIINQIVPFGIGGFRYKPGISYSKEFKNGKKIFVAPVIDYGFYNKDFKGSFEGNIMYNPLNFSKVGFEIGDVYDFISGSQNVLGSIAPSTRVRNRKFEAFYSREIVNGLYIKATLLYSLRESITNLTYPDWLTKIGMDMVPQAFDPYRILMPTFDLEYHFKQKYTIRKNKKIVLGSIWPVVFLKYKSAIPSVFSSEANFDYLEFQATHTIKMKSFGNSNFRFITGSFLHKKDLRLIEHKFFRPSDMGYFSNPVFSMQLLDTNINTSNSFLQANFIHHFNGFFLNKVWLLNKLKLEETIGGGMLIIPNSNFAQIEFYAGLERKIRIKKQIFKFGLYAVAQDNSFSKSNVQIKWGLNFYDVFRDKWDY